MAQQVKRQSGGGVAFGVTSLVTGILAFLTGFVFWLSLPLGIVAVVFGALGISKPDSKGLAIAGLVTGAVGLIIALTVLLFLVIAASL